MANIRCPACSSENVMFSRKRGVHLCEDCEHEFTVEKLFASMRIFLSYGQDSNEELVRRIKADLEKRDHDVWFDKSEIKFGDNWRRSISDGIVESDRVLSFLSKHSTRDPGGISGKETPHPPNRSLPGVFDPAREQKRGVAHALRLFHQLCIG